MEVEPEAVEVNGNGHHADGIGPTVELVLDTGHYANGNGHAAVEVNGNGHSDEAPEPQQSLFSWAEFMAEEPVKPKGHSRKAQPATLSMFEWALTVEQEREEELVGAGTLGRNTQGEVVATSAMASPCTAMCAGFFAFQPARFMCAALFCCPFPGGALIPLLRPLMRQMVHLGKRQAWKPIRGDSLWT